MAWIEVHQTRGRHPKTLRLAALLKTDRRYACGLLDDLWCWALDIASRDGDLPGMDAEDIADALDFPRNKGEWLVGALTRSGYMDEVDGGYRLHDWDEYAGRLNDRRDADKKRKSEQRRSTRRKADSDGCPTDVQRMSCGCPADVQRMSQVNDVEKRDDVQRMSCGCPAEVHTVPYPNRTVPERTNITTSIMGAGVPDWWLEIAAKQMREAGFEQAEAEDAISTIMDAAETVDQAAGCMEYLIRRREEGNLDAPNAYAVKILEDWRHKGLTTRDAIEANRRGGIIRDPDELV